MSTEAVSEARRQVEICNACRYCEGYCSVFPAMTLSRSFADGDITQLANLCHDCRGCYYACQYAPPHEFNLNLPKALAAVRQESWQNYAVPRAFARTFHTSGAAIAVAAVIGFALLIWAVRILTPTAGDAFYAVLSHNVMVAIFAPAFVLPLLAIVISVRRYWRAIGGKSVGISDVWAACASASRMRNLSGGHGEGCNFEDQDRFSNARRGHHHLVMYGFLLCFAATTVATIMHYGFDRPAPYALFSLPKILGLAGGISLAVGTIGLAVLKLRSDKLPANTQTWGGEMAFIVLLFTVSTSGLALYLGRESSLLAEFLAFHLGAVLAFFLLMPYSKMVHGFFRLAALTFDEQQKRAGGPGSMSRGVGPERRGVY
jgi:citrate/tricarballylate utilization protein